MRRCAAVKRVFLERTIAPDFFEYRIVEMNPVELHLEVPDTVDVAPAVQPRREDKHVSVDAPKKLVRAGTPRKSISPLPS